MNSSDLLPLAPQGVFPTIQGEGALMGLPMVFVRFAGCHVNCLSCDTDYSLATKLQSREIARMCIDKASPSTQWIWLTGGEPMLHDLRPLCGELHDAGYLVAIATSGEHALPATTRNYLPDFFSVSPHRPERWVLKHGDQLNLVPSLNNLKLDDSLRAILDKCENAFRYRYVTPCEGKEELLNECIAFVNGRIGWQLGIQAHKYWGVK